MDLKELSASLGLSPTTVSRALNGYTDVSEATRKRVAEAAALAGYSPNVAARRLARGRTDAIGIVYPFEANALGDPRFLEIVIGMTERLRQQQIDLQIMSARASDEMDTYRRLVRDRRVDALVVARTRREDPRISFLLRERFPFLAYGRTDAGNEHAWFDFDNQLGSLLAMRRLVAFGHRRIAYLHAGLELSFAAQRHAGYGRGLLEAGLLPEPAIVREAGITRRGGYETMKSLLAGPALRPSAVLVDNNLAGLGAMRALHDAGLVLGSDISAIVYDGVPDDSVLPPPSLTWIEQPTPQTAGEKMAEMLLGLIEGREPMERHVLWEPRLVEGASDGPVSVAAG